MYYYYSRYKCFRIGWVGQAMVAWLACSSMNMGNILCVELNNMRAMSPSLAQPNLSLSTRTSSAFSR